MGLCETSLSLLYADRGFLFLRIFVGLRQVFFRSHLDPYPHPFLAAESFKL
nr:MAG TPA: hypothetical protein [Bacteriophage sp.]